LCSLVHLNGRAERFEAFTIAKLWSGSTGAVIIAFQICIVHIAYYLTCMLTAVSHQEGGNDQRIWLGVLSRDGHTPHFMDSEELALHAFRK